MIGMYYKYIGPSHNKFINGEWYECIGDINMFNAFIDEDGVMNGFAGDNHNRFDLSNPSPHKRERKIMFHEYEKDN